MSTILGFLGADHRICDGLFSAAEEAVAQKHWDDARGLFDRFRAVMTRHLAMEEKVLFPALEAEWGFTAGPTRVMRMEHDQMRELMNEMDTALGMGKDSDYLGVSETLNMLMQQHNVKEESKLYPMSDQTLAANRDELIREMDSIAR